MKRRQPKKLVLRKTTIVDLSRSDLGQVAGAGGTCTCDCYWAAPTISGCPKPYQIIE